MGRRSVSVSRRGNNWNGRRCPILRWKNSPCPLPVVPDAPANPGSSPTSQGIISDNAPEPAALKKRREDIIAELAHLHKYGLSVQIVIALLRHATASDATFLTRTVGLPAAAQQECNEMLVTFIHDALSSHSHFLYLLITCIIP